jgi:hypothetical protein
VFLHDDEVFDASVPLAAFPLHYRRKRALHLEFARSQHQPFFPALQLPLDVLGMVLWQCVDAAGKWACYLTCRCFRTVLNRAGRPPLLFWAQESCLAAMAWRQQRFVKQTIARIGPRCLSDSEFFCRLFAQALSSGFLSLARYILDFRPSKFTHSKVGRG